MSIFVCQIMWGPSQILPRENSRAPRENSGEFEKLPSSTRPRRLEFQERLCCVRAFRFFDVELRALEQLRFEAVWQGLRKLCLISRSRDFGFEMWLRDAVFAHERESQKDLCVVVTDFAVLLRQLLFIVFFYFTTMAIAVSRCSLKLYHARTTTTRPGHEYVSLINIHALNTTCYDSVRPYAAM